MPCADAPPFQYSGLVRHDTILDRSRSRALLAFETAADDVRRVVRVARLLVQVGARTGLIQHVNPRAACVLLQGVAKRRTNPSLVYRLQAALQPDKTAIVSGGQRWSFRQLNDEIDAIGAGLQAIGVGAGGRAVMMLRNRPELIALQPAMSRIGAAGVSISWRSTPSELAYLVNHSRAQTLFFEHDLAPVVRAAMRDTHRLRPDRMFAVGGAAEGFARYEQVRRRGNGAVDAAGDDAAVIIYT
ncbi:MAG: long-chain fatty acid--CoA ligase, partial [Polyangiaceae bacterium]|nr:long-chain fatty acid--CoA ligase [Polyangiaceae bacterium]